MADSKRNNVLLRINTGGNVFREIQCNKGIADLLQSPTTDPAVKQDILDTLLKTNGHNQNSKKEEVPQCSTSGVTNQIHIWTEKEEDLLVNLRHTFNDDFIKVKNHNQLWMKICTQLNESKGTSITAQQALNKYSSLKKKYKEIMDSPSGSEKKYFRHLELFSCMYGTKAGTKPAAVMDSMEEKASEDEVKEVPKRKSEKKTKRKSNQDIVSLIQDQHAEFKDMMVNAHKEKMSRMDRMLDLYERELSQKK